MPCALLTNDNDDRDGDNVSEHSNADDKRVTLLHVLAHTSTWVGQSRYEGPSTVVVSIKALA